MNTNLEKYNYQLNDWTTGVSEVQQIDKDTMIALLSETTEDSEEVSCYEEFYKPIPLTAEILEKNGFGLNNGKCYIIGGGATAIFETNYCINIDTTIGLQTRICGYKIEISYIHQLQQVLRLCGLKDLANNFKI